METHFINRIYKHIAIIWRNLANHRATFGQHLTNFGQNHVKIINILAEKLVHVRKIEFEAVQKRATLVDLENAAK